MKRLPRGVAYPLIAAASAALWYGAYLAVADAPMALPPVPGAFNPGVNQYNIKITICQPGWTATVRPAESWTEPRKLALVPRGKKASEYEYDHLIPLELGGAAADEQNLWLQPIAEARVKDRLENRLREMVCAGQMPLDEARQCIAANWVQCNERVKP